MQGTDSASRELPNSLKGSESWAASPMGVFFSISLSVLTIAHLRTD